MKKTINSQRHQEVLEHAITYIRDSGIAPYVNALILYGSCAKNKEKYTSDVDLLLELDEKFTEQNNYQEQIIFLRGTISPHRNQLDPDIDLKIVIGDEWKSNEWLFFKNVRDDGVEIWN